MASLSLRTSVLICGGLFALLILMGIVGNVLEKSGVVATGPWRYAIVGVFFTVFIAFGFSAVPVMVKVVLGAQVSIGNQDVPVVAAALRRQHLLIYGIWALMGAGTLVAVPAAIMNGALDDIAKAAPAPSTKSDRDRDELSGLVKTVEISWKANHKNDSGEVEERNLGSATYDRDGALVVDQDYTASFVRERKPERRGPTETLFHSPMGDSLERYVLDAAGNIAELRKWYKATGDGAPNILERMTYDVAGREVSRESFDENSKSLDLTLYTRDERGFVIIEEDRPADRRPPYPRLSYTYKVDAHGNWIEKDVRREHVSDDDYDYRYAGNLFRTITYY